MMHKVPYVLGGITPYVITKNDTFATKQIDLVKEMHGQSVFTQIENYGNDDVLVMLNNSKRSILRIGSRMVQIFNTDDLPLTNLAFQTCGKETKLQILLSIETALLPHLHQEPEEKKEEPKVVIEPPQTELKEEGKTE